MLELQLRGPQLLPAAIGARLGRPQRGFGGAGLDDPEDLLLSPSCPG